MPSPFPTGVPSRVSRHDVFRLQLFEIFQFFQLPSAHKTAGGKGEVVPVAVSEALSLALSILLPARLQSQVHFDKVRNDKGRGEQVRKEARDEGSILNVQFAGDKAANIECRTPNVQC
jgi:hypothetical protein